MITIPGDSGLNSNHPVPETFAWRLTVCHGLSMDARFLRLRPELPEIARNSIAI